MKDTIYYCRYFQTKYRILVHKQMAAIGGAYGESISIDALYNALVNDKGCQNTNKPGDLKVTLGNR